MKKQSWIIVLLLSLVTCGIYSLYLWFTYTRDHNIVAAKYGKAQISSFIVALLLGVVTCGIYAIYWMYKFFKQNVEILQAKGVAPVLTDSPILLLILCCIPIISYYVLVENHNLAVDGE